MPANLLTLHVLSPAPSAFRWVPLPGFQTLLDLFRLGSALSVLRFLFSILLPRFLALSSVVGSAICLFPLVFA